MKRTEPVIFRLKLAVLALMASLVLPSHLVAQSAEETKLIARAEQAITELTTLQAKFIQISSDGTVGEGQVYFRRPFQLRLDYTNPETLTIVTGRFWVYIDDKIAQTVEAYPVSETPFAPLLAKTVSFRSKEIITEAQADGGIVTVQMEKDTGQGAGRLALEFEKSLMAVAALDHHRCAWRDHHGYLAKSGLWRGAEQPPVRCAILSELIDCRGRSHHQPLKCGSAFLVNRYRFAAGFIHQHMHKMPGRGGPVLTISEQAGFIRYGRGAQARDPQADHQLVRIGQFSEIRTACLHHQIHALTRSEIQQALLQQKAVYSGIKQPVMHHIVQMAVNIIIIPSCGCMPVMGKIGNGRGLFSGHDLFSLTGRPKTGPCSFTLTSLILTSSVHEQQLSAAVFFHPTDALFINRRLSPLCGPAI